MFFRSQQCCAFASSMFSTHMFVLAESVQSLPKRRQSKPKVRSGCLNCKTRRIKCDESKPACQRCLKSRRECEYPAPRPVRNNSRTALLNSSRVLVPKEVDRIVPACLPSILKSPAGVKFQNQQEYKYFQIFCEKTLFSLAGFEETDVWSRLVLQACERQESIRRTVIAIGALDQTLETVQSGQRPMSFDLTSVKGHLTPHHQFALQQYGKAVKKMREDIKGGLHDLRITVISCLLFVAFELFHGNHTSALNQASFGLKMIIGRMKESRRAAPSPSRRIHDLFSSIDESLIQKFVRLDLSSMAFVDENVIKDHLKDTAEPEMFETLQVLPPVFSDLSEAQKYWELSMRPIMNFMTLATSWEYVEATSPRDTSSKRQHIHVGDLEWRQMKVIPVSVPKDDRSSSITAEEPLPTMNPHLKRALHWSAAFEPLFLHSRTPEGSAHFTRATLLKIRLNTTLISATSSPTGGEVQYDKCMNLFREIVNLVREISNDPPGPLLDKASFTFDVGIVGSLYVTATRCRDCLLRREAISLLLAKPRRECIWDNVVAARVSTVVMIMEEAGLQGGFIPEGSRIRVEGLSFDLLQCRGRLRYSRGAYKPLGERTIESIEITW